eukprot:scaffold208362_cov24-Tisochrysis_lutea.AAC.5
MRRFARGVITTPPSADNNGRLPAIEVCESRASEASECARAKLHENSCAWLLSRHPRSFHPWHSSALGFWYV